MDVCLKPNCFNVVTPKNLDHFKICEFDLIVNFCDHLNLEK